ncbi:MAG: hypothetical protein M2R45_05279 [Verrucomicrobia subdivision 3 bacterium]|nr:hypothetical protein [Limisphaerales bacterium]MCS1417477.1 hypothetical protein [Limisphaerales bacterium]
MEQVTQDYEKRQIELVGLSDSLAVGEAGLRHFQIEEQLQNLLDAGSEDQLRTWCQVEYGDAMEGVNEQSLWSEVSELLEPCKIALNARWRKITIRLLRDLGNLDFEESRHFQAYRELRGLLRSAFVVDPQCESFTAGDN